MALSTGTRIGIYEITNSDPLEVGSPVRLFQACGGIVDGGIPGIGWFEASATGTRFLITCSQAVVSPIVVSVDWAASLK
jgi:hypothetical protein